jgi:multidrug efflux pump subunit AcrB
VRKLADVCIHRPVFATMLILAMVVAGAVGYRFLAVDRYPAYDLPTVTVRTELPGGAPEEAVVIGGADHIFNVLEPARSTGERVLALTVDWLTAGP